MRYLSCLILLISLYSHSQSEVNLSYYLEDLESYDINIPQPSEYLLHKNEIGNSHVSHDRLVQYMYALAKSSERIIIENRGETYEGRPILILTISSKKNLENLETIRQEHISLNSHSRLIKDLSKMPVVIYQGYSIHGNEPSGSNAAMIYAYHLAASKSPETINSLNNAIILLDPSFNPDGLQRFAHWANTNKSMRLNPDSSDREFDENWPGGRTNHYWFDMNRDWLPVQLPESKARIKTFHKWSPNILTDHHEMGTNSTFFYQPGIPTRVNPLTPIKNQSITAEIGKFHEKRLSEIGSVFYSEEDYDDFYYGKGSTFPDVNGSIGILFEQASSRGHLQNSINGEISFPFTIKNQLTTSLSSLEAAISLKEKLLNYQRNFFKNSRKETLKNNNDYYLVGDNDKSKLFHFYELLKTHEIKIKTLPKNEVINNVEFNKKSALLIPKNQNKSRLVKAMFEERTEFKDSLFYDISAWSFLHSFNLNFTDYSTKIKTKDLELEKPKGNIINKSDYAYLFSWDDYYTPKALYRFLDKGVRVKVATKNFKIGSKKFDYGTLLITIKNQDLNTDQIHEIIQSLINETGIVFHGYNSSYTYGIDLGSNDFVNISKPNIALIVGEGVTSYDAGEIWHLLDTRYQIPITKIKKSNLSSQDLSKYNTLILANGNYNLTNKVVNKIKKWVEDGGNIIGFRNTINWLNEKGLISVEFNNNKPSLKGIKFKDKSNFYGSQLTSGAIFNTVLDKSHPINYGYNKNNLSIFRNTNIYMKNDSISFNNPITYSKNPLISGYISKENLKSLKKARPFAVFNHKKGKVAVFSDNTNFRAFWYGTNKLMMNAIFFINLM